MQAAARAERGVRGGMASPVDVARLRASSVASISRAAASAPTWDVSDYTGKYHRARIAKTLAPIPGTQLARERGCTHLVPTRFDAPARMRAEAESKTASQLAKKERVRAKYDRIRSTYGWQANATASTAMCKEIDKATHIFAARQEPDPVAAEADVAEGHEERRARPASPRRGHFGSRLHIRAHDFSQKRQTTQRLTKRAVHHRLSRWEAQHPLNPGDRMGDPEW